MSKPCFGDSHYYNETSRGCVRCEYFRRCGEKVNNQVNDNTTRSWGSRSSAIVRRNLPTQTTLSKQETVPGVVRTVRESPYDFNRPVGGQLVKYAGFSMAEVCLEEVLSLVRQARQDYVERVNPVELVEKKGK